MGILNLAVGSYRNREIEMSRDSAHLCSSELVLNPDAPAWTPGPCSSREHGDDDGVTADRGGKYQSEKGREYEAGVACFSCSCSKLFVSCQSTITPVPTDSLLCNAHMLLSVD